MIALHRQSIRSTIRTVTLLAAITSLLLAMTAPFVGTAYAAQLSVSDSLDQWANGKPGTNKADGFWRNGNLNPQNSQYAEGDSIGFRRILGGFTPGQTYKVSINYDTVNSSLVAYDYLTSWDRSGAEYADPTTGTGFSGDPDSEYLIPVPGELTATAAFPGTPVVENAKRQMAAWGAHLLFVGNYSYSPANGSYSGSGTTTTTVDIVFDATSSDVVLAWGGHIAVQSQWAYPTAPRNTNGSPYHMRNTGSVDRLEGATPTDPSTWPLNTPDSGNAGNQDRSIKAGAILLPGLNITKGTVEDLGEPATVEPGDSFTYQLTVSNTGEAGSELTNVVVTDDVPDIFDINGTITTTQGTCAELPDQYVTCELGTIPAAGAVTINIPVTVDVDPTSGQVCATYTNHADATADGGLSDDADHPVTVTSCAPLLDIAKSTDLPEPAEGNPEVGFGDSFNYLLTVTNDASATANAESVVVTDTIPGAFAISATPTWSPGDGTCEPPVGQDIECNLGNLAPGAEIVITVPVDVTTIADGCDTFPNVATADAGNHAEVDSNTVSVDVTGCEPSVSLTKTNDAADGQVDIDGGQFDYTLTATNASDATGTATGVWVTDTVPTIFDIDSASYQVDGGTASDCTVTGNDVSCGAEDLAPGSSMVVTISVTANADNVNVGQDGDKCGTVTNDGEVYVGLTSAPTSENTPADSDDTDVDVTGCGSSVSLTKTNDAADGQVDIDGGQFDYTLTATNASDATGTATGVWVSDTVPTIFDIDSASYQVDGGTASDCTVTGNDVSCGAEDLAPGSSMVVTISVTANADNVNVGQDGDKCGTVTNDGEVYVGLTSAPTSENTPTDSDDTDVDVTGCGSDVSLTKTNDAADGQVDIDGGQFDYTLTATNASDATGTATGVWVTDTVPTIFDIDSASYQVDGGTASDCTVTGNDVSCGAEDLAPGSSMVVTISVTANADNVNVGQDGDKCGTVTNDGEVYVGLTSAPTSENTPTDSDDTDVDVTGCGSDVSLTKTNDAADGQVDIDGGQFDYTLTATNASDATGTATGVWVTDTVPTIFDIDSASYQVDGGTASDCTVTGNDVSCGAEDLAPGSSMVVTISVTANADNVNVGQDGDKCGTVTNDGEVYVGLTSAPTSENTPADSDDTDVDVTGCGSDVSILKSVVDDVTSITVNGGTAVFRLEVSNASTATASAVNVNVDDVINSAFIIVRVTPEDCTIEGQSVSCGPVDIAPGETYTVDVQVAARGGSNGCGTFPNAFDATWVDSYTESPSQETSNTVELGVTGCTTPFTPIWRVTIGPDAVNPVNTTHTFTATLTTDPGSGFVPARAADGALLPSRASGP